MGDIFFDLQKQLMPVLCAGDITQCEFAVAERLAALPNSPFHIALDLSITNPPEVVAAYFDRFFQKEEARFKIAAAYTEMNGFDINPNRWFCDAFAYHEYGGHYDYDWISDWQSEDYDSMTITGLERLQEVYASDAFCDGEVQRRVLSHKPVGRHKVPGFDSEVGTAYERAALSAVGHRTRPRLYP